MAMTKILKYLFAAALLLVGNTLLAQTKDKPLFTFGIMADVQYADQDNAGTRHYRRSPKKLAEAVDSFNRHIPAFVLSLGDYIDKNFSSYDTLNPITARLTMHLYHALGNHEFSVSDNEKEKVLQKENLEKPYYSFEKSNWRFMIINGNDVSLHAHSKGSAKYKEAEALLQQLKADSLRQAQTWNGAVGKEQLAWLEKELATAQKKNQKVIMAAHFPLYPDGATELLWNTKEVRALIEKYPCVFAYFNGHVHKSQYFFEKGVHYVSFRGMVELEDNAFAVVTAYPNRLEIKGFGKEVSRKLE
jgi:manganese-dependent ADP-ribose/CDP-alcohol diphosphatase